MRCSVQSARSSDAGEAAFVHDGDAVAHVQDLLHVAADHQDRHAVVRPGRAAAGRFPPWRRRRCRASARRRSAPSARARATWRAPPSAGCRRSSVAALTSIDGALTCSWPADRADGLGAPAPRRRARASRSGRSAGSDTFSRIEKSTTRPADRRSSGTRNIPWRMASAGSSIAQRLSVEADRFRRSAVRRRRSPARLPSGPRRPGRRSQNLAAADGERHGVLRIAPRAQPVDSEVARRRRARAGAGARRRGRGRPSAGSCCRASAPRARARRRSRRRAARPRDRRSVCTSPSRCVM